MASGKRLIDVNDVYSLFCKNGTARLHVGDIDMIPRVDAVEVKHGRWEPDPDRIPGYLRCSICKDVYIWGDWREDGKWNYCPNCGNPMDGDP